MERKKIELSRVDVNYLTDHIFIRNLHSNNSFHYHIIKNYPMYLLLANPETFEIHKVEEHKDDYNEFETVVQLKPPPNSGKDVFHITELSTIEGLNFEQIMNMMYSEDQETKILVEDILVNYQKQD